MGLATARPQRWSICSKIQGSTVLPGAWGDQRLKETRPLVHHPQQNQPCTFQIHCPLQERQRLRRTWCWQWKYFLSDLALSQNRSEASFEKDTLIYSSYPLLLCCPYKEKSSASIPRFTGPCSSIVLPAWDNIEIEMHKLSIFVTHTQVKELIQLLQIP